MPRASLSRAAGVLLLAAGVTVLVALLSVTVPMRMVEARAFDYFATARPPSIAELSAKPGSIVVVAIDEPSFAEIGLRWPWPRSLHAELTEALRRSGAQVVALDLVFSEPSTPEDDAALAAAMGPDVVLASDATVLETPQATLEVRSEPLPEFLAAGATQGLASVALDPDGVFRRMPPWGDSFAAAILQAYGFVPPAMSRGALVQPMGPARTYPTVSYYQALDPEAFLPPDTFRDRIVLVGVSTQAAVELDEGGADRFATPFTARTGQLVPGVEVQAAVVDTLRHGLALRPIPAVAQAGLVLAAALLAALIAMRPTDARSYVAGIALVALLIGGSWLALAELRLVVPAVAPSLAVALVLAPVAGRDHASERRMRREITRAFGQYLAPAMVERLARNPEQLRLGGEVRVLSVLFCDVRNFTPMAERMRGEPEGLTNLVNRILTPLSDAVLARGGTIDKYIGDCIMAFWNAPLDDPDHAAHAVEAALDMLSGIDRLNDELAAEAAPGNEPPRLAVGVGVNTGTCVVGNMGSNRRFDYSALGDAVNYASRLESASKDCGVPLLLSATTAAAVREKFDAVIVDRIAVKGRSEREPVYTVMSAERIAAADLACHVGIVDALLAGTPVDRAAAAELTARHPRLAPVHARIAVRVGLAADGADLAEVLVAPAVGKAV